MLVLEARERRARVIALSVVEVPLDRLSDDDRKFAEDLIAKVPK